MTLTKWLLPLGLVCALGGLASDKSLATDAVGIYSLTEISAQSKGMLGNPMPNSWFHEPEPGIAQEVGYFAHLDLSSKQAFAQTFLTLYSKQQQTITNIIVEVRDGDGQFLSKYLVQIEPEDALVVSFHEWAAKGSVQFSLFSSQDFGAAGLTGRNSQELLVRQPKMELLPNKKPDVGEQYRECATSYQKITITNQAGSPVTAWAYAWAYPNGADQYLQHLKVYYPNSWTVFHHPLKTGWGPWCAFTIGVVKTNTSPGATSGHHSWSDPLAVLEGNSTGTVDCLNPMICGYNSWTWEKP